jgi:hypothetical protein
MSKNCDFFRSAIRKSPSKSGPLSHTARPVDQATIDYLIDIGRILSGELNMDADEKSDVLFRVTTVLNVTEKQLAACKGKNIRITVRQIMKMMHPDPPELRGIRDGTGQKKIELIAGRDVTVCRTGRDGTISTHFCIPPSVYTTQSLATSIS